MYGMLNDCFEKFIVSEYGQQFWDEVVRKANVSSVIKGGWIINQSYPDEVLFKLASFAAYDLATSTDELIERMGCFFLDYTRNKGYDNLLRCQGNSLRDWISNINEVHTHLEMALSDATFVFPEIYCIDEKRTNPYPSEPHRSSPSRASSTGGGGDVEVDEDGDGDEERAILLYHKSPRGPGFATFAVGIIRHAAEAYFDISIQMHRLECQGVNGSEYSIWRITESRSSSLQHYRGGGKQPLSRAYKDSKTSPHSASTGSTCPSQQAPATGSGRTCPFAALNSHEQQPQQGGTNEPNGTFRNVSVTPLDNVTPTAAYYPLKGLSGDELKAIFPFHFIVNRDFIITQVGDKLDQFIPGIRPGTPVQKWFRLSSPACTTWTWPELSICKDSSIELEALHDHTVFRLYGGMYMLTDDGGIDDDGIARDDDFPSAGRRVVHPIKRSSDSDIVSPPEEAVVVCAEEERAAATAAVASDTKASAGHTPSHMTRRSGRHGGGAMFLVQPDIKSISEMITHQLTWSDFPKHSAQQKLILLAEHLKSETAQAIKSQLEVIHSKHSLEMKRMFVRYVSHEIRTPLNTVMMGLDLILGAYQQKKRGGRGGESGGARGGGGERRGESKELPNAKNELEEDGHGDGDDGQEYPAPPFTSSAPPCSDSSSSSSSSSTSSSDHLPDGGNAHHRHHHHHHHHHSSNGEVSSTSSSIVDMVMEIKDSCDIAIGILNDLLLYEKLEGGIVMLEKQWEPALAVVFEAIKTFNIQARQAGISLDFTFDDGAFSLTEVEEPTYFIDVDKAKISQVLRNMVSNAIKFSSCSSCSSMSSSSAESSTSSCVNAGSTPGGEGREAETGAEENAASSMNRGVDVHASIVYYSGSWEDTTDKGPDSYPSTATDKGPDSHPSTVTDKGPDSHPSTVTDKGPDSHPSTATDKGPDSHPSTATGKGPDSHPSTVTDKGSDSHPSTVTDKAPDSHPSTWENTTDKGQDSHPPYTWVGTTNKGPDCIWENTTDKGPDSHTCPERVPDETSCSLPSNQDTQGGRADVPQQQQLEGEVAGCDDQHAANNETNRPFLRIEVIDQGPGISPKNQALLFQNIVQFDPNTLQGGGGSGLGLYISKGIMDLHGGSIGVFSEGEGKGSTFHIDIPVHKAGAATTSFTSTAATTEEDALLQVLLRPPPPLPCISSSSSSSLSSLTSSSSAEGISPQAMKQEQQQRAAPEQGENKQEEKAVASKVMMTPTTATATSSVSAATTATTTSSVSAATTANTAAAATAATSAASVLVCRGGEEFLGEWRAKTFSQVADEAAAIAAKAAASGATITGSVSGASIAAAVSPKKPLVLKPPPPLKRGGGGSTVSGRGDDHGSGKTSEPSLSSHHSTPLLSSSTAPSSTSSIQQGSKHQPPPPLKEHHRPSPMFKVLVVDDSVANRKMIARFLRMSNLCDNDPTEAEDGAEAVRIMKRSLQATRDAAEEERKRRMVSEDGGGADTTAASTTTTVTSTDTTAAATTSTTAAATTSTTAAATTSTTAATATAAACATTDTTSATSTTATTTATTSATTATSTTATTTATNSATTTATTTPAALLSDDGSVGPPSAAVGTVKVEAVGASLASSGAVATTTPVKAEKAAAAAAVPYDVILMDFIMPVMDGPTATKRIRELGYTGLIIGITGNVLPEDRAFFIDHGANTVMNKPLDVNQLRIVMMQHN